MSRHYRLLPMVLAILMVSCVNMKEVMNSWMGHHYTELLASWGPPTNVYDDGQGGRVLQYMVQSSYTMPGRSYTNSNAYVQGQATYDANSIWGNAYGQGSSTTTYVPPQTYTQTRYRTFWIDRSGKIYRWQLN